MIEDNKWSTFMQPEILRKQIYKKITTIANFATTENKGLEIISLDVSNGVKKVP